MELLRGAGSRNAYHWWRMKILHIIRGADDRLAERFIEEIEGLDGAEQAVLLIQDGVYMRPKRWRAFACAEDVRARGVETEVELVDYDRIVELILEYDKMITW